MIQTDRKWLLEKMDRLNKIINEAEIMGFDKDDIKSMRKIIGDIIKSNAIELTQEVFHNQPKEVDWAGVDYDGLLNFGKAINPRYTWASERWRGFDPIGDPIENSNYITLTEIYRK